MGIKVSHLNEMLFYCTYKIYTTEHFQAQFVQICKKCRDSGVWGVVNSVIKSLYREDMFKGMSRICMYFYFFIRYFCGKTGHIK